MGTAAREVKLLQKCLKGDSRAFERIVAKYQELVCAITYSATANIQLSEELAHQTFINAWKNLSQLNDLTKFQPWLCAIARNNIRNHINRNQRDIIAKAKSMENIDKIADEPGPLECAIKRESEFLVREAVQKIPQRYREPMILYYRQQQSVRKVALSLDLSENAVKQRLQRGRKMIKEQLSSIIEETLSATGPKKTFTMAVTASVAGLAIKGSGSVAAITTTVGTPAAAGAGGILSAAAMKVTAAATAVVICAGAVIYSQANSSNTEVSATDGFTHNVQPQIIETASDPIQADISGQTTQPPRQIYTEIADPVPQLPEPTIPAAVDNEPPAEIIPPRNPDWPGLDEEVKYIYTEHYRNYAMETHDRIDLIFLERYWIRVPDAIRIEESFTMIDADMEEKQIYKEIIDNGKERLVLDPNSMEAQFEQTFFIEGDMYWQNTQRVADSFYAEYARVFRDPNSVRGVNVIPLPDESDDQILVYRMEVINSDGISKAWVDKRTLLPERIEWVPIDPDQSHNLIRGEMFYDFSPICDSIFSTDIPEGYESLPDKQANTVKGVVVDLLGNPIPGAEVYLSGQNGLSNPLGANSDANGEFEISLIPYEIMGWQESIGLWAILPNDPELVGWTMFLSPSVEFNLERRPLGGVIPGCPGTIYPSENFSLERTDSGVSTQGGWFTGASDVILVMETGIEVFGYIEDIYGNPVSDIEISVSIDSLSDINKNHTYWLFPSMAVHTHADENGRFRIFNAPKVWESCSLRVSAIPSAEMKLLRDSKAITIADPNEAIQADIVLFPEGPTVRGVLVDNYGNPLSDRYVYAQVRGKVFPGYTKITDAQGLFEFVNCPADEGLEIMARLSSGSMARIKTEHEHDVYFPDVIVNVGYHPEQDEYEVKLVAVKPEIEIEAIVVNSAGDPLPFYPVEIRADGEISHRWKTQGSLHQRTDENGYVRFVDVPEMKGLRLACAWQLIPESDFYESEELQKYFKQMLQEYRKYKLTEVYVPLEPGRKHYEMHIVVPKNKGR